MSPVILNQMNSKRVFLIGEIGKTGPIEMTPGMTLLEAIATPPADLTVRQCEEDIHFAERSGTQQKIPVQYKQALKGRPFTQSDSESRAIRLSFRRAAEMKPSYHPGAFCSPSVPRRRRKLFPL